MLSLSIHPMKLTRTALQSVKKLLILRVQEDAAQIVEQNAERTLLVDHFMIS